jgi:hypothetical protein
MRGEESRTGQGFIKNYGVPGSTPLRLHTVVSFGAGSIRKVRPYYQGTYPTPAIEIVQIWYR